MNEQARLIKLCELWQRKSAKTGKTYFSGFLGDVQVLMFRGGEITRPNGEVVQTWKLFVQERDPERRPAAQRHGGQPTTSEPHDPAAWSKQEREAYAAELASRITPDSEPGF